MEKNPIIVADATIIGNAKNEKPTANTCLLLAVFSNNPTIVAITTIAVYNVTKIAVPFMIFSPYFKMFISIIFSQAVCLVIVKALYP
jgi:hypothetical protein